MPADPSPQPSRSGPPGDPPSGVGVADRPPDDEVPETELNDQPSPIVYPVGIALWVLGAIAILSVIPPAARSGAGGIVLFLLPLAMAVFAAFVNIFTRPGRSLGVRLAARTLTFACLWPFVAWGQWDSRKRR